MNSTSSNIKRRVAAFLLLAMITIFPGFFAIPASGSAAVNLVTGESRLMFMRDISRVAIADPNVADVAVFGSDELFIQAKSSGVTDIHVWARGQRRTIRLEVSASSALAELISSTFPGTSIRVSHVDGVIVLTGVVSDYSEKEGAERLALAYSRQVENLLRITSGSGATGTSYRPEPSNEAQEIENLINLEDVRVIIRSGSLILDGKVSNQNEAQRARKIASVYSDNVIDLLGIQKPHQIFIESRIVDVDRNAMDRMGINWSTFGAEDGVIRYEEVAAPDHDLFKVGRVYRTDAVLANLQAIVNEGKGRVVANPHLLTVSGEKASLNVGGEIPVPMTTYVDGRSETTIAWERWGINVEIEPEIDDDGNITTVIRTEVSTLDRANGIMIGQSTVPAKRSRVAETVVSSRQGSTVVISGLIQKEETERIRRIPLLSDIPGLKGLFTHREKVVEERELLIFLTPSLADSDISRRFKADNTAAVSL